ncbi:MAG: hypothetical protein JNK38_18240 [Acidobacteria bacterium]|nr:hypothetical protein [Acidobacteriota bacterium]
MKVNSGKNRWRLLAVATVLALSLESFAQTNGAPARPGGDVINTSGKGNSTKTTGTQGVNHGKGGNTTKKTGKNIPQGLPDGFNTRGGKRGGPILSGDPGKGGVNDDVSGIILNPPGKGKPGKTQPIPGLPGRWACVDLKNSPYDWDRKLANKDDSEYNCHYYTRMAMGLPPSSWGAMTDLNTKTLPKLGYKQVNPAEAKIGDIILVEEPASGGGVSLGFSHSGIVTDAVNGLINNVRQKASPQHCVIDTSFYNFKRAFVRDLKYITLWRKN